MDTFVQPGETLAFTAPTGGVTSGQPYLIGTLVAIAMEDAAEAASFSAQVEGVYLGTKVATEAWTEGLKVYWDDAARKFTSAAGSSPANTLVGVAVAAIADAITLASSDDPSDLDVTENVLTVIDRTGLDDKTITITIARDDRSPLVYTITEGVDFTQATSEAATATAIAAAISTRRGVTAVASTTSDSPPAEIVTVTSDSPVRGRILLDGATR